MKHMSLIQIANACHGQIYGNLSYKDKEVSSVVIDSRLVEKDSLFIATVGERVDGHDFITSAFQKGALAVLCEKLPIEATGPCILVESTLQALKDIAKWYRSQLSIKVVGITGSVGKTSTKEFISSVLQEKYQVLKTEGNFNNEIGLPLTILKIREQHELAVLEMGISDFGEMHRLSEMAQPDIAVITNIGPCHLENLGDLSGVLKAKSEIFDYLQADGSIVINGDDATLATLHEVHGVKPLRFGLSNTKLDTYGSNIQSNGLLGSVCQIHSHGQKLRAEIPLPGEHMVRNALAATTVGFLLGLTKEEIEAGIAKVKPVDGRSNIIQKDSITIIDDCYNANPISMKAAIDILAQADNYKIAILGDMFELGENQNNLHYEVGVYGASRNIDALVCIGKLSSYMYDGAASIPSHKKLLYFETRDEFIHMLPSIVKENSTILVKASHGMGFANIVKVLIS